nr:hypothetical protein [Tanacetum cinerariifolium]
LVLAKSNSYYQALNVKSVSEEIVSPKKSQVKLKWSCKSSVELEYQLEEVYKATTDQLDWVNPEGASSRKYTTSVTKTKAADYG